MHKFSIRVTVAIFTFLLGVAATLVYLSSSGNAPQKKDVEPAVQETQGLRLLIPQAVWEPFNFRDINERIKEANLPSLRTVLLPDDDIEVRIWFVAGYSNMESIILRRSTGQWSGIYLYGVSKDPHSKKYQRQLAAPKSGWEETWKSLDSIGILTLPDASEVQCNPLALDGVSYVVETNTNKTYRTYMYGNPQVAECDEAKQMIKIVKIMDDEFGTEWNPIISK